MLPSSISVSREHRRAKTDRPDTELLMRASVAITCWRIWSPSRQLSTICR